MLAAVEAINPAVEGNIGGLNLPVLLAWPMQVDCWLLACRMVDRQKRRWGLRSDYLAIATLGIAEIIIAIMKNEDWLARGVKNVYGIPRTIPCRCRYEIELQKIVCASLNRAAWAWSWIRLQPRHTLGQTQDYSVLFLQSVLAIILLCDGSNGV